MLDNLDQTNPSPSCFRRRKCASSNNRRCIQREFLKEKLRVKERYLHPIFFRNDNDGVGAISNGRMMIHWIVPDGLALRMYLPLIVYLAELQENYDSKRNTHVSQDNNNNNNNSDNDNNDNCFCSCRWVILESVSEYMNYRSISSTKVVTSSHLSDKVEHLPPETAGPHERTKIQKLIQRHRSVTVFCDLSVREGMTKQTGCSYDEYTNNTYNNYKDETEDEWDRMRYDDMTMIDRSQNALLRGSRLLKQYYYQNNNHNPSSSASYYILTGDPNYITRFPEEDGIQAILMKNLLEILFKGCIDHHFDYAQKLATRCEEEFHRRNDPIKTVKDHPSLVSDPGMEEYWTEGMIQEGLFNKTLVKGRLTVTKENIKEAIVLSSGTSGDSSSSYFINHIKGYFNRALHEDIVIIKTLPRNDWTSPVGRRRLIHFQSNDNDQTNINETPESDISPPIPSGRVVAIANTSRRQFVATMVDVPMNDESACLVVPMDVRIPKIRIKTNGWRRFVGQRLWVQILQWDIGSNYPSGRCLEILGPIANLETEIKCLLKENNINLDPFSAAAQACLPLEGDNWQIPPEEILQRKDLRSLCIFSVDPIGCQDIDDTFHARVLPNGDVEIGVHIADVTYFVQHDSPLDKEAQIRATTFYLVDRRFDMLPSILSGNLCSLHGDKDRLAVSTIWIFSRDFKEVKDFWYGRTVIRNYQAMTYDQAHNILHDLSPDDPSKSPPPPLTAGYPVSRLNTDSLKHDLSLLTNLARKLKKDREDIGGAVDLSSGEQGSELKFSLDRNHKPVKVTPKKQLEIHHTVAELMIMANTWVAKTIHEKFPTSALLRIHQNVDESRFEDLKEILSAGNITFDGTSNMKLADSLKNAERSSKSSSAVNSLFQSLATRAMSEAQYVSTGDIGNANSLSHYGLGIEKYTHFTSPIRRYADIVVHRQLLLTLTLRNVKDSRRLPPSFHRKSLKSVPESQTLSIIRGEGIMNKVHMKVGSTEDSASNAPFFLVNSGSPTNLEKETIDASDVQSYSNRQVSLLCKILNQQNRMAKLSSFECQGLFLSLYFKDQCETTKAVVTNLRSNGFWAYIPKFDFRAPIYLSDKNGVVQIDPALLNLKISSGYEATENSSSCGAKRNFPSGSCTLFNSSSNDEYLEIAVEESKEKYQIKVLDVVTCMIFCDDWDAKSRIPRPKVQIIADTSKYKFSSIDKNPVKLHTRIVGNAKHSSKVSDKFCSTHVEEHKLVPSLYDETQKIETPSELIGLDDSPSTRMKSGAPKVLFPGRLVYGSFVNPDSLAEQKRQQITDAAASALERRNQNLATRTKQAEYDINEGLTNDATTRMQRLAASKRNARKVKSKK